MSDVYVRQNINGTSPQDIKNMNDNMSAIWQKVFGDINLSDTGKELKNQLYTNWLQPQGEGNLDADHDLYVRFYVPETTKTVNTAKLNVITSRYRIDSDTTSTINTITTGSTGTSDVSGGTVNLTSYVDKWGKANGGDYLDFEFEYPKPDLPIKNALDLGGTPDYSSDRSYVTVPMMDGRKAVGIINCPLDNTSIVDMFYIQHRHKMSQILPPHHHDFAVTIEGHYHNMNMHIKDASTEPSDVTVYVNDHQVCNPIDGDNQVRNNIEITDFIQIGSWNIIKVTASAISRVTLYGIVELTQNYN